MTSAVRKITNSNPKYCLAQQSLFQLCKNYSANCPSTIVNYFNLQVGRNFLRRSEIRMRSSYQQFKTKKNRNYGNGDKLKFFVFRAWNNFLFHLHCESLIVKCRKAERKANSSDHRELRRFINKWRKSFICIESIFSVFRFTWWWKLQARCLSRSSLCHFIFPFHWIELETVSSEIRFSNSHQSFIEIALHFNIWFS